MAGVKFDEKSLQSSILGYNLLRSSRPNSNFLVFSESFYITRFKNKGYRYHLGKEDKTLPKNTSESKADRKNRYIKLMKKNNWTRAELARHLGVSFAWVSKVFNK